MSSSPFIHKFSTDRGFYIYDVNTNRILKAEQIEYDLIDDYAKLPGQELLSKCKREYNNEAIEDALKGISRLKEKGHFSSRHPQNLSYPVKEELLDDMLDSKMEQLILNITERCNLRCRYCLYSGTYHLERKHSNMTMTVANAKKAIRSFKQHSRNSEKVHISFYGGEPLTCFRRMQDIIKYIKSLDGWPKIYLHVDTNGTLLTDEMMDFFIENGFFIQVSLDGPEDIHDKYRVYKDGRGTFNRIADTLVRIRDKNREYFDTHMAFAVTVAPPYDLMKINDFFLGEPYGKIVLAANFIEQCDTTFFDEYTSGAKTLSRQTIEKLNHHYISSRVENKAPSSFARAVLERGMTDLCRRSIQPMEESVYPNGICIPGVRRIFVSADGKFYPCEKTVGSDFVIGDVDNGVEPARVKKLIDGYLQLSTPDCCDCWAVRLCKLCFFMTKRGDRMDKDRKRRRCVVFRDSLHSTLKMYTSILEQNTSAFDFVKDMVFE